MIPLITPETLYTGYIEHMKSISNKSHELKLPNYISKLRKWSLLFFAKQGKANEYQVWTEA